MHATARCPAPSRTPPPARAPVPGLRARLKVGGADDRHEREADRVAAEVMRAPGPRHPCACGGGCPRCRAERAAARPVEVARATDGASESAPEAPAAVHEVLREPGHPLDAADAAFLGPRFGRDFGRVRIHAGPRAAASADTVGARAYAVGHHVVFAAGEYRPGTAAGRRLLAHELAHVAQQDGHAAGHGNVLRRDTVSCPPAAAPATGAGTPTPRSRAGTAASSPRLEFLPAVNPPPCACLVFIHHNERNARLTARLLHRHCRYNLAIVSPTTGDREIRLPRHADTVDPNQLFTPDVAAQCWADPQPCCDFLAANAGSRDPAIVEGFAQRQFFLAIRDCSDAFTLPVIGLHNNVVGDTAGYRRSRRPANFDDVRRGTFDQAPLPATGADANPSRPLQELRDWLAPYGRGTMRALQAGGMTNIFRWCMFSDIGRCHVGDPAHPDRVSWVTNEDDFARLSALDVNVVLQTGASATGESATDLSSLFLVLRGLVSEPFAQRIEELFRGNAVDSAEVDRLWVELDRVRASGRLTTNEHLRRLGEIMDGLRRMLQRLQQVVAARGERTVRLAQLRFINIETPSGADEPGLSEAGLRVSNFETILATLQGLGLRCCGDTPAAAEGRVREGLRRGRVEEAPR